MDKCLYCEHELIKMKNEGWQHACHDGVICLVQVGGFRCGCDTPFLRREGLE